MKEEDWWRAGFIALDVVVFGMIVAFGVYKGQPVYIQPRACA